MAKSNSVPTLLQRLQRAVERSGLIADPVGGDQAPRAFLVTGRLALAALNQLQEVAPAAHGELVRQLRALGGDQEWALLAQGQGYTYLHVVHFIYQFARAKAGAEGRFFAVLTGRAGGGLQNEPETDITSLVRLLVTALPPGDEGGQFGLIVKSLAPMMLDKVYTTDLLGLHLREAGPHALRLELAYLDPGEVDQRLAHLGLGGDGGAFFLDAGLQVQGTLEMGLDYVAAGGRAACWLEDPIEARRDEERAVIAAACACSWTLRWDPQVQLQRLHEPEEILAQVQTIYETMHRRDLEYFQERVRRLETRVRDLEDGSPYPELVGSGPAMGELFQLIGQVAATDLTAMIRGESGTGKELVARAIHQSSQRRERPFVAVHCAAFPEHLLESELFGHEKGAFTGADRAKPGRFELADGGTLFLDEAGDIPLATQVKLLRVLETRTFERLGGTQSIEVDLRFIAATNQNIEDLIDSGALREDFYFRLNVLPVHLPPLRQRPEDIAELARHFIGRIARRSGKEGLGVSRGALEVLVRHDWPGNVRELQNVIERAVAVYARGDSLSEGDIVQALGSGQVQAGALALNLRQLQILRTLAQGDGMRLDDLLAALSPRTGEGWSKRTLQNDVRKLDAMGLVQWIKQGSARRYTIAPAGREQL